MHKSSNYLSQLTWLRGIAAFLVIMSHALYATDVTYTVDEQATTFAIAKALDMGDLGVLLFFTLSGATLFISSNGSINSVLGFYIKRFFRIWPAFAVALLAYILFAFVFQAYYVEPQGHWVEKQFLADYSANDVIAYLTMTSNFLGQNGLFNGAFWSLPVEFQYYLIFPLILLSLSRLGIIGPILIGLSLIAANYIFDIPVRSSSFFRLGYSFCGGVLLGYLYTNTSKRFSGVWSVILLPPAYAVAVGFTQGVLPMPNIPFIGQIYNIHVFFAFLFVAVFMFTTITLPNKIEQFLEVYGTISYSTYLYHNLVIGFLTLLLIQFELNNELGRYLFMVIATLILTQLIALGSYKLFELPPIKIGRFLVGKLESKKKKKRGFEPQRLEVR